MFTFRPIRFACIPVAMLLVASAIVVADPPAGKPDTAQVVPWSRKATKDLPRNRTGGSLTDKGIGDTDASLFFVAPKSTGLTTAELPTVYWYISEASKQVTFTLVRDQGKKTELRLILKDVQPGFHTLDLAAAATAQDFKALESNDWTPATNAAAPQLKALYRMAIKSEEPKLLATAYIARVQAPPGQTQGDYTLQIKNELWYDAVQSLASQLSSDAKNPAPRRQFTELLQAEEVLRSDVADTATEEQKKKARREEETVFQKLSVPDPIDLKSDKWEAKLGAQSVPDPIDLK